MFRNKTAAEADGPGKCYDARKKSKGPRDFLTRHKIKRITPPMIAYAALQVSLNHPVFLSTLQQCSNHCQAYIGLSTAEWTDMVGTFSLVHFYHVIIKTLSNSTLPWVIKTMEWWQRYVVPSSSVHMPDIGVLAGRSLAMEVKVPPRHQGTSESLQTPLTGVQPNASSNKAVVESSRRVRYVPGHATKAEPILTSCPRIPPSIHIPDGPSVHRMGRGTPPQ